MDITCYNCGVLKDCGECGQEYWQEGVTYTQADKLCTSYGKRLCTYEEATAACRGGKDRYNYPYGR